MNRQRNLSAIVLINLTFMTAIVFDAIGPWSKFYYSSGLEGLIIHFYQAALYRNPESKATIEYYEWFDQQLQGFDLDAIAIMPEIGRQIFFSQEYQFLNPGQSVNKRFVFNVFNAFLLRDPTSVEFSDFQDETMDRGQLLNVVTHSKEFVELMRIFLPYERGKPAQNFSARMYEGCLDRTIDKTGLDYWVWLMTSNRNKRTAALKGLRELFNSPEFNHAAPTVRKKVECLYRCLMDRYPNPNELGYWMSEIRSKRKTLNQCLSIFGQSPAFSTILDRFFPGQEK